MVVADADWSAQRIDVQRQAREGAVRSPATDALVGCNVQLGSVATNRSATFIGHQGARRNG
jgi:hypothetical protein